MAVRLLLDTHALIWSIIAPSRLPQTLRSTISDPATIVFASPVAAWEIAIKVNLKKLHFPVERLQDLLRETSLVELPFTVAHGLEIRHLPPIHRDPFDRLLIAQARVERLILVTRDDKLRRYPVDTLWE